MLSNKINIIIVILINVLLYTPISANGEFEYESFFKNNEAVHTIGARIEGDKLIVQEDLMSPAQTKNNNNSIYFHFPINNYVVTFIELGSDSNVRFEFSLGVKDEDHGGYLSGFATALERKSFNFHIKIYGFERTDETKDIDSILLPQLVYKSIVEPKPKLIEDHYFDEIENDEESIIKIGNRQPGDVLLHTEKKTSGLSDIRSNHTVKFYYIDTNYITAAIVTAISSTGMATAVYSQVSPHSLKITINDNNVFELNAYMEVYGFYPEQKPDDYIPMLPELALDPNLDGVRLQSLSDDIEFVEAVEENILAPENLCKNFANQNTKTFAMVSISLLSVLILMIIN